MASTNRNALIATGCAIAALLAICTGALVAGVMYLMGMAMDSDFASSAVERASRHPEVIEALGEPIESQTWGVNLNLTYGNERDSGELSVALRGSHDSGQLEARGERLGDGPWTWHALTVTVDDREIDVLAE